MKEIVNLGTKSTIQAVINAIQLALGIHVSAQPNFAGFSDDIQRLDQSSELWIEKTRLFEDISDLFAVNLDAWWSEVIKREPSLASLHLILTNIADFKNAEPDHYKTLMEILEDKTKPENRYDKVEFSYEVHEGGVPI